MVVIDDLIVMCFQMLQSLWQMQLPFELQLYYLLLEKPIQCSKQLLFEEIFRHKMGNDNIQEQLLTAWHELHETADSSELTDYVNCNYHSASLVTKYTKLLWCYQHMLKTYTKIYSYLVPILPTQDPKTCSLLLYNFGKIGMCDVSQFQPPLKIISTNFYCWNKLKLHSKILSILRVLFRMISSPTLLCRSM